MRTDAPKNNRKKNIRERCCEKSQKNTIREQQMHRKNQNKKLYKNRSPKKNPAETVQTFSKKIGTPNKNSC